MPYTSNIIPLMTAANTPYGVASADSNLGSFYPYKAFDRSNIETDSWVAAVGTRWLSFQFPASAIVTRYAITSRTTSDNNPRSPKTWTLEGSNDGSSWTTLDTQTNVTDWAASVVTHTYDLANTASYIYYRVHITASNDGTYVGIGELALYETDLIPTMTSNTAPSGVASASSEEATPLPAYKAFNDTSTNNTYDRWATAASTTGWLRYEFITAYVVKEYALTTQALTSDGTTKAPKTWTLEGSNDGTNWTTLDTQTNVTDWGSTQWGWRKTFPIANTTAYLYYRVNISASNDSTYIVIGELEMMGYLPAADAVRLTITSRHRVLGISRLTLTSRHRVRPLLFVRKTITSRHLVGYVYVPPPARLSVRSRHRVDGVQGAARLAITSRHKVGELVRFTLDSMHLVRDVDPATLTLTSQHAVGFLAALHLTSKHKVKRRSHIDPGPPPVEVYDNVDAFCQFNGIDLDLVELQLGGTRNVYDTVRHYDGSVLIHDLRGDFYEHRMRIKLKGSSPSNLDTQEQAIQAACLAGGTFAWQSIGPGGVVGTMRTWTVAPSDAPDFERTKVSETLYRSYAPMVLKVWPA